MKLPSASNKVTSVSSAARNYAGTTHNNFVTSVTQSGMTYNYSYTAKSGTGFDPRKQFSSLTITGPNGYNRKLDYTLQGAPRHRQLIKTDTDSLGNKTTYGYTVGSLISSITFPEGNRIEYKYDSLGNVKEQRTKAKPGTSLADLVITANYDEFNCFGLSCYRPKYTIDAKR